MQKLINLINLSCNGTLTEKLLETYLDTLDLKIVPVNDGIDNHIDSDESVEDTVIEKQQYSNNTDIDLAGLYVNAKMAQRKVRSDTRIMSKIDMIYRQALDHLDPTNNIKEILDMDIAAEVGNFCAACMNYNK